MSWSKRVTSTTSWSWMVALAANRSSLLLCSSKLKFGNCSCRRSACTLVRAVAVALVALILVALVLVAMVLVAVALVAVALVAVALVAVALVADSEGGAVAVGVGESRSVTMALMCV